jgi:excisionase family DNA binding protein
VQYNDYEEDEILDVQETATYLHCSKSHVSNILNSKTNLPPIPHVRAGRKRLIRKASLVEWFKAQEMASLEAASQC